MRFLSCLSLFLLLVSAPAAHAQTSAAAPSEAADGIVHRWFAMVSRTQAAQPHWITPLATTTPRLEQEFRFDVLRQTNNAGIASENYDGGKGLELIPAERVEMILNLPPYLVHNTPTVPDGFGDFSFLIKYRLLSANEESGNYILTVFFAAANPTGSHTNGARDAILTPTVAYGKGFRRFDAQGTFGAALPVADTGAIGRTYAWNNAFQYHIYRLWPEIEINSSFFQQGKNAGKKQTFVTPGLVIGRLHLWRSLGLTAGVGFQIAATHFHTTNHNEIFSLRFPF